MSLDKEPRSGCTKIAGRGSLAVQLSGDPMDPELSSVEEAVFPVNPGSGFKRMEQKIVYSQRETGKGKKRTKRFSLQETCSHGIECTPQEKS
jgi:hypothetical protein